MVAHKDDGHTHGVDAAGAGHHQACGGGTHGDADKAATIAVDPVCGMRVDPATAKHRFAYRGQEYLFCGARCRTRFEAEPENFLNPKQPEAAVPTGTIYTCPMHPEVRQVGPGGCPICGMALEPEQVSLDDAPNPELIDMTRRFWIALALTFPVFAIDMAGHFGLHLVSPGWSNWISLALSTPVNKSQYVTLLNTHTKAMVECVIVRIEQSSSALREIGMSFLLPNRKFWQLNFPQVDRLAYYPEAER